MAKKIKGIYKSFKFISQIFVVKDREMEIGYPTDVKHVAHIGWDHSPSITAPSWMNEFRTSPNLATHFGSTGETTVTTWSNQDTDDTIRGKTTSIKGSSSDNHGKASKKNKSRKPSQPLLLGRRLLHLRPQQDDQKLPSQSLRFLKQHQQYKSRRQN